MIKSSRFTSAEVPAWGRSMGRQLDPLDAAFGVPVEVVGGYAREVQGSYPLARGLDDKKAELKAAKDRAKADAIARAKEEVRRRLADKTEGKGGSPPLARSAGRLLPYAAIGVAVLAAVFFLRKKG